MPIEIYTEEIAAEVCKRLAKGESLRQIAITDGMPAPSTVVLWTLDRPGFAEQYARARRAQAELMFDEILQVADGRDEDPNSRRLRVDARKWILSKVLPKIYGDKLVHEGGDKPIQIIKTSVRERMKGETPTED